MALVSASYITLIEAEQRPATAKLLLLRLAEVYLTFAAMPDLMTIAAGSLDAPETLRPAVVSYAIHGCEWDVMDPALASFAKMPG